MRHHLRVLRVHKDWSFDVFAKNKNESANKRQKEKE
jgi:hypothetical protein